MTEKQIDVVEFAEKLQAFEDTFDNGGTNAEKQAAADAMLRAAGGRMPTATEVIKGFAAALADAFPGEEGFTLGLTMAAARYASKLVETAEARVG